MCKLLPCDEDVVGAPVFQVVVPWDFCSQVLGQTEVRQKWLCILKHVMCAS